MGYSQTPRGPVVFDIETVSMDGVDAYVPAPDLQSIQAAKNLKDPAKIAEDISKRRADALSAHAAALNKAALDFNLARIVAIGWTIGSRPVEVVTCENEGEEREALAAFWCEAKDRPLIGFRIRSFDAPMLMSRSRFLDVRFPLLDLSRYARGGRVQDLWDSLTFGLNDYDTTVVMPRKLKTFAKRFGLPCDDETCGADIADLVANGEWDKVKAHCESDVILTKRLAERIGITQPEPEQEAAPIF